MGVFFRRSRADNSVVGGPIWPKFRLVRYSMHVLVTYKFEMDLINSDKEKVTASLFKRSRAAYYVISCGIWPKFELIQALMYVLVTCKYKKDRIKTGRENVEKPLPHYKVMGIFLTLKGSKLRSLWSDLAEFRTDPSSYVFHRYLQV